MNKIHSIKTKVYSIIHYQHKIVFKLLYSIHKNNII